MSSIYLLTAARKANLLHADAAAAATATAAAEAEQTLKYINYSYQFHWREPIQAQK